MAKANIERAMQMLDPDECANRYELPNIMARDSFRLEQDRVQTFDELMDVCHRYIIHHLGRVVAENAAPPADQARGLIWNLLEKQYKGGAQAAFKAATKGYNGGLPGILDTIRDFYLKEQEDHYFNHTVMECVDVMDLEDIKALMEQYLRRYGRSLDGENMPTAEFLVSKYRDVIRSHAQIVRNVRTYISR